MGGLSSRLWHAQDSSLKPFALNHERQVYVSMRVAYEKNQAKGLTFIWAFFGSFIMTYFQFHFVFIIPPLLLLLGLNLWDLKRGLPFTPEGWHGRKFALWAIFVHILLALVYTTPWDNYLVYKEVWGYPPGRVMATIGYVPVEEYLFFILQTILTSLWMLWIIRRVPLRASWIQGQQKAQRLRIAGVAVALVVAALGLLCLSFAWGTYLGLILIWAGPVVALQWGYGGDLLLERWRPVLLTFLVPSLYLWVADRIAIGLEIWWINPEFTTGLKPFGLPIEEALFFLLTNVFVAFGLSLALHPESSQRLKKFKGLLKWQNGWKALLGLWALSLIPTPLMPQYFSVFAYISTSLLALAVLAYTFERYGPKALMLFALSFAFGLFIEWLGETTGFPFGRYQYADKSLALLGVPLLVPLGWWAFSIIALAISPKGKKLFFAPLALVAWDIGLDPIMVSQGFWQFERGIYYGVPLSNFFGWYFAGLLLVYCLLKLEPRLGLDTSFELSLAFVIQAFLLSVGLLFFGMPLASLFTFLAMGALAALSLRPKTRKASLSME